MKKAPLDPAKTFLKRVIGSVDSDFVCTNSLFADPIFILMGFWREEGRSRGNKFVQTNLQRIANNILAFVGAEPSGAPKFLSPVPPTPWLPPKIKMSLLH